MKYLSLGKTGLYISELSMGTMTFAENDGVKVVGCNAGDTLYQLKPTSNGGFIVGGYSNLANSDFSNEWIDSYKLNVNNTLVDINIFYREIDTVPIYEVNITNMSKTTKVILEKIREEFISQVGFGVIELSEQK